KILSAVCLSVTVKKNATGQKEPQYKPYDNAYFFILFVMLFYSFLALTVFFGYVRSKKAISKKDPYQEFIEDRDRKKWNMARPVLPSTQKLISCVVAKDPKKTQSTKPQPLKTQTRKKKSSAKCF
uniref:Potassium voltage-gated channel subfamily E regulatory subunit 4 n=1 Tax=Phasianus colchicus TaxID=9054 RepID=A0A669PQZ2_PHACC